MNVLATIDFHDSLENIKNQLIQARKDSFNTNDRIIILQSCEDEYPYIDAPGSRLIELQQLLDQLDITNCFVLYDTHNPDIAEEINEVVKNYSYQDSFHKYSIRSEIYNKQVKQYSNTSCIKLWDHLYISPEGNSNACCLADPRFPVGTIDNPRANLAQLKEYVNQGYRIRTCAKCYRNEDQGLKSARVPCDKSSTDVDNVTDLDIRVNNLCNFKCRMCSEEYSSAIQAETVELYGTDAKLGSIQFDLNRATLSNRQSRFLSIEPYINQNIKSIYFAGGEPLLVDEHYKILDKLLEIEHTDLQIRYNTNMSTLEYKGKSIFEYWKHFSNVNVGASIDCCRAEAEYIRHGTVWSDIEKNIVSIQQNAPHVKLEFASVVSSIGCESLINLQQDYINSSIEQTIRVLTHPQFLSVAALPQHHKQRLSNIINEHISFLGNTELAQQWKSVLQYMNNYDYSYSLSEFKQRMQVLDKHRGESFVDVFPQFADLYD